MNAENRKEWDPIFRPDGAEQTLRPKEVDCVFCLIILNNEYMAISRTHNCVVIKPRNPVVLGHILVVPQRHSKDATEDPYGVAMAMKFAFDLVQDEGYDANIITSIGPEATQTVFHTHIHVVPRKRGDGLHLPWTGQKKEKPKNGLIHHDPDNSGIHIQSGDPGIAGGAMMRRRMNRMNIKRHNR